MPQTDRLRVTVGKRKESPPVARTVTPEEVFLELEALKERIERLEAAQRVETKEADPRGL